MSVTQETRKRNFHIQSNDIFNNKETYNEKQALVYKRGKKQVENIKTSNFQGPSINLDYNNSIIEDKNDSDILKYRKYCDLKNKENHLKAFLSPISFVDFRKEMKEMKEIQEKEMIYSPSSVKTIKTEVNGENKRLINEYIIENHDGKNEEKQENYKENKVNNRKISYKNDHNVSLCIEGNSRKGKIDENCSKDKEDFNQKKEIQLKKYNFNRPSKVGLNLNERLLMIDRKKEGMISNNFQRDLNVIYKSFTAYNPDNEIIKYNKRPNSYKEKEEKKERITSMNDNQVINKQTETEKQYVRNIYYTILHTILYYTILYNILYIDIRTLPKKPRKETRDINKNPK